VSDAAVLNESAGRAFDVRQNIDIRRFGGNRHRYRGQRGFAIEAGSGECGTG
jgi:hypothetical protein